LDLLPRLFTRIRQERAAVDGITLLVDLGRSCMAGAWICDATDGRGMLVAMDAMGYDAFHIGPADPLYSQPGTVQQLRAVIVTQLAAGPWAATVSRSDKVFVFVSSLDIGKTSPQADLMVALRLSDSRQVEASWQDSRRTLLLDAGWLRPEPLLGRLDIALPEEPPYIQVVDQTQLGLPPDLLPDPTIMGVIEFVESEARYAERKRGQR
jgi:hypothetical protein